VPACLFQTASPTIAYPHGVDGVLLRVLEAGAGPDAIILLHGVGARADRWQLNMGPLADAGFHVFAIDFPGHGFAEKTATLSHGVPAYSRLVRRFVDEVSPRGLATLIGTSLGGHVAAAAALADPEAFRSLVLVGPVGFRPLGEKTRRRIAASIADTSVDGIWQKLSLVLHRKELLTEHWVSEEHRVNNSPGAADALGEIARYFVEAIDDDVLSQDEQRSLLDAVPTLFVWGDADEVVPLSVAAEVERSLRTSVVRIAAAGHVPYYENPADFNDRVLGFLTSLREAARGPGRR
jgi:2-hydroxy-6-oxonona-2,4-dienedioate hydrolase